MTLYASADEALDLIPTIGSLLDSSVPSTSQAEGYAIVVSAEIDLHFATLMADLGLPLRDAHDALNDAVMAALAFIKLRQLRDPQAQ